jgi:hypothetical protein
MSTCHIAIVSETFVVHQAILAALSAQEPVETDLSSDEKGPSIISIEPRVSLGAFGTEFIIGLLLSIPIGVSTGVIANWLSKRLTIAATRQQSAPISMKINNISLNIVAQDSAEVSSLVSIVENALSIGDENP